MTTLRGWERSSACESRPALELTKEAIEYVKSRWK